MLVGLSEIYYQSLGQGFLDFLSGSFSDAVKVTDLEKLVNITLVPYGNTRQKQSASGWTFTCQNGPEECLGNIIATCAINILPKTTALLFIRFFEDAEISFDTAGQVCSAKLGLDWNLIKGCTSSRQGNDWQHDMADNKPIKPAHQYVPWVVVEGIHDDLFETQVLDNLLRFACNHSKTTIPKCKPFLQIDNDSIFNSRKYYKEDIIDF